MASSDPNGSPDTEEPHTVIADEEVEEDEDIITPMEDVDSDVGCDMGDVSTAAGNKRSCSSRSKHDIHGSKKKGHKKHKGISTGNGDVVVVGSSSGGVNRNRNNDDNTNHHHHHHHHHKEQERLQFSQSGGAGSFRLRSVVKLYAKKVSPSQVGPWKMSPEVSSTGTGFIIENNRLLTNAHVVYQAQSILCRPQLGSRKFECEIESISLPLDLAVLTVKDRNFFHDKQPLSLVPSGFENLPHLDDNVTAVGFPTGGDQISVTRGVVSRITHNASKVLWVQIDAAINPGNSGGPVFNKDGQVMGVACAGLRGANNIGYIIPSMIFQLFFNSTKDTGSKCNPGLKTKDNPNGFCGVASLGIGKIQKLENPTLRQHLGMKHREGGVRVRTVDQVGACYDSTTHTFRVQPHDVLLSINGITIGEDGTVQIPGRPEERIPFETIVASQLPSIPIHVSLLRSGKVINCPIIPIPKRFLCPQIEGFDAISPPLYLICGGFVFMVLTRPLASAFKAEKSRVPSSRLGKLQSNFLRKSLTEEGRQIVVLSSVLASSINNGYHDLSGLVLRAFNGVDVFSLQHLATLIQNSKQPLLEFRLGLPRLNQTIHPDTTSDTTATAATMTTTTTSNQLLLQIQEQQEQRKQEQHYQKFDDDEIIAIMDRAACIEADPIIRKAHLIASPCSSGIDFQWPSNTTPAVASTTTTPAVATTTTTTTTTVATTTPTTATTSSSPPPPAVTATTTTTPENTTTTPENTTTTPVATTTTTTPAAETETTTNTTTASATSKNNNH